MLLPGKSMVVDELLKNAKITVFIGKNGSGKSTLLRNLDQRGELNTKYISPERGGSLKYDPNIENSISQNVNYLQKSRRTNRFDQFRQQSAALFKALETAILREIEKDESKRSDFTYTFDTTLNAINELLPQIKMVRSNNGFSITTKSDEPIKEESISSGEAELISLAIETLVFARESTRDKILLMDEPDVHLHPDLQHKFTHFLLTLSEEFDFQVVVATHSTAILSGLSESKSVQVVPITNKDQTDFRPFKPDEISKQLLPVFGVHPLASHFNANPLLLVEGEDDRRVIEQMIRSSKGRHRYAPAVVGSVQEMNRWEQWLSDFLPAIYDEPKAYSLRDQDDSQSAEMDNLGCVTRARLNCYAMENLLLTNECFIYNNTDEASLKVAMRSWIDSQPEHQSSAALEELLNNFSNRRTRKVKDLRNVLLVFLGSSKPWEVLVGQLLANLDSEQSDDDNSLHTYIGPQALSKIFGDDSQ